MYILYLINIFFQFEPIVVLIVYVTFFHVEQKKIGSIKCFWSYTQKTGFTRNTKSLRSVKSFISEFDTTILKQKATLCQNFKFVYFELNEK